MHTHYIAHAGQCKHLLIATASKTIDPCVYILWATHLLYEPLAKRNFIFHKNVLPVAPFTV